MIKSLLAQWLPLAIVIGTAVALDIFLLRWRQKRWRESRPGEGEWAWLHKLLTSMESRLRPIFAPKAERADPPLEAAAPPTAEPGEATIHPAESTPPEAVFLREVASPSALQPPPSAHINISLDVPVGTTVRVTVEAFGEGQAKISTEKVVPILASRPLFRWPRLWQGYFGALRARASSIPWTTALLVGALLIYATTRLVGLTRFPIYFFTDEAIHTVSAADLVRDHFKNSDGVFLPTYFKNGNYYNLGTSVYIQVLPYLLFGRNAVATRAVSALVTLLAAGGIAVMLLHVFKVRYGWVGVLLLAIAPAWFLHSRTAFETAEFTSFYAATLCAYLLYRYRSARFLYPTLLLAGIAFYTYSPGQIVIALSGVLLLLSDLPYHWKNRRLWPLALVIAAVMVVPYLRFRLNPHYADAPLDQLRLLASYWVAPAPLTEKIRHFLSNYGYGLSAEYWYVPNEHDFSRHLMKGYGNLLLATLPFAVLGLTVALWKLRSSAHRAILIALLATPAGAALVDIGITRTLAFVIPATLLTALGLSSLLEWLEDPKGKLAALPTPKTLSWPRLVIGALILGTAAAGGWALKWSLDGQILIAIGVLLSLGITQIPGWLLARIREEQALRAASSTPPEKFPLKWRISSNSIALVTFAVLGIVSFGMLRDALVNGPTWYSDYGLGGLQYGAFQIFDVLKAYRSEHPDERIIFSPNWTNGADVVARFFLGDDFRVEMASVLGHMQRKLPLDEHTVFVIIPEEYNQIVTSDKFTDLRIEQSIPCPDGNPCFYFARLRYVDDVDKIFAAEREARRQLLEADVMIDGQPAHVRYSMLDMGEPQLLFDDDLYSVARTLEANPFVVEVTFSEARTIQGMSVRIGSSYIAIHASFYPDPNGEAIEYDFGGQGQFDRPDVSMDFPQAVTAQKVRLEMQENVPEPAHVHIWEITFK